MTEAVGELPARLRIGAVARLAGISVHTLRKWEERYGAVSPARSDGGGRVYSRADLERVLLIRQLADAGMALREVAGLPTEELARLRDGLPADRVSDAAAPARRVLVAGPGIAGAMARNRAPIPRLKVVASAPNVTELGRPEAPVDALVVEVPALLASTPSWVREVMDRLDVGVCVVVYGFASRTDLVALQAPDVATLRAPVDLSSLLAALDGLLGAPAASGDDRSDDDIPAQRYSEDAIARLAASAPRVDCECPHHLADIVLGLRAFEAYSQSCESANPEDAALHRYLWRSAAHARALFEDAIEQVALAEGIDLGE